MFKIGKITQTFGLKGEVKVFNLSDYERFTKGSKLYVYLNDEEIDFEIEKVRLNKNRYIIKLKDIDHINDVLKYVGLDIYAPKIKSGNVDEFHYSDLINRPVYLEDLTQVGVITSVIEVPQGHILEIKTKDKKALIPFVKEYVGDVNNDKIIIFPIEGML